MAKKKNRSSTYKYVAGSSIVLLTIVGILLFGYCAGWFSSSSNGSKKRVAKIARRASMTTKPSPIAKATPPTVSTSIKNNPVEVVDDLEVFLKKHPNSVVAFMAKWCGHCQQMKPAFNAAASKIDFVKIGIVDGGNKKFVPAMKKFGVRGFPTILYFKNHSKVGEYSGNRKASDLVEKITKEFT